MPPWQVEQPRVGVVSGRVGHLCHSLWRNLAMARVGPVEGHHAVEVASREPADVGKVVPDVGREPRDDGPTPALLLLAGIDHAPDVPVEVQHLGVTDSAARDLADVIRARTSASNGPYAASSLAFTPAPSAPAP